MLTSFRYNFPPLTCVCRLIAFLIMFLIMSCSSHQPEHGSKFNKQLKLIDGLLIAGKGEEGYNKLRQLRTTIPSKDPFICTYYCYVSSHDFTGSDHGNAYADSALSFFNEPSNVENYPKEYRQALLTKGDACFKNLKYITAVTYYAQAKKLRLVNGCDNGDLAVKIAGIYYEQGNYRVAARLFIERYERVLACPESLTPEKKFIILQGALNNAAYSYERAGMIDSALIYYHKDVSMIDSVQKHHLAAKRNVDAARAVVFDNLGGIMTGLGKLDLAITYLIKSIALSNEETDPTKATTYIKLANAYLKLGDMAKAKLALDRGKDLLSQYPEKDYRVRWLKVEADYLFKAGNTAEAFQVQAKHLRLKDSLSHAQSELYRLDVAKELNSLQEKANLADLQQKARYRKVYLAGIVLVTLLSVAIIFLIIRNLRRTLAAKDNANRKNQQLQQTLAELERVNQNYIRIMRVMAHDLRNPLGGISGLAQVLLDDEELNEDSRHMLNLIETTSIHSLEMINELLKSDIGDNGPLQKGPADINALLYESTELLQFKANEKGQQIHYHGKSEPVIVQLNYEKIWRVFNNLIVNALKFSHKNEIIEVTLQQFKDHVLITVADRGIGIPEQNKDAIFEMFTPAKRVGTNGEQPFGLGLSISRAIIERHNGKVWFENRNGGGTNFFVSLPY
jgi:signal transduction histidine kinase